MKTPSLKEIKQELSSLPDREIMDLLLRLIRSRKENKELISYLVFESHNEAGYIKAVKDELDEAFSDLPAPTKFMTKKALFKILRSISKYARQTGSKQAEVELLIYFCRKLKTSKIRLDKHPVLEHIYLRQVSKAERLIEALHDDLGYDYKKELDKL